MLYKIAAVPTPTNNSKASLMYNNNNDNEDNADDDTESKAKRQRMQHAYKQASLRAYKEKGLVTTYNDVACCCGNDRVCVIFVKTAEVL